MKKLVAFAAVAVVGGAFAACIDGVTPNTVTPAAVYQWQFKGKTATGVITSSSSSTGGGCIEGGTVKTSEVIRVPGSLAITAYTYICDDECTTFNSNLMNPTAAQWKMTKPLKSEVYNANFVTQVDAAHVIGKKASQYELGGVATFKLDQTATSGHDPDQTYTLTFAGFGSYSTKAGRLTSVCGNFAGTQAAPVYPASVTMNGVLVRCPNADYWNCDTLDYAGNPTANSVAYGTWSIKYNSAASKKLANDKTYRVLK